MNASQHQTVAASFDQLVASRVPILLPKSSQVVSITKIAAPGGTHPGVRRVRLSSGLNCIVKRHLFAFTTSGTPYDVLEVERETTDLLKAADCTVPAVLGTDPENGLVILEDVGSYTLDDVIQTCAPVERCRIATRALGAFVKIQNLLADYGPLSTRTAPDTDAESVRANWRALEETFNPDSLEQAFGPRAAKANELVALVQTLSESPLYLGPSDYNARNIVSGTHGNVSILEWSKLGYDWPERRIVQYLTSLGVGRSGSRPRTLVDKAIVDQAAGSGLWNTSERIERDLDGHHLIFHILLGMRWRAANGLLPRTIHENLVLPLSKAPEIVGLRESFGSLLGRT